MSYVTRHTVVVTTDALGDAEVFTNQLTGRLVSISYVKDDFAAGVDFEITTETTEIDVWKEDDVNATKTVYPRHATHTTAGVANATPGDVLLGEIYLAQERLKIVVDDGGNAASGTFYIIVDGPTG